MAYLYGIEKAVITPLETSGGTPEEESAIEFTTAQEAEIEPVISEGAEEIKRDAHKVLAVVREDDLLYGYDIKLVDNAFSEEMVGIVCGYKLEEADRRGDSYGLSREEARGDENLVPGSKIISTPMGGGRAEAKPFQLDLYVANYEGDSIKNYCKITFHKCEGKFPTIKFGKEFTAPEFEIKARENTKAKKPIKSISFVTQLPPAPEVANIMKEKAKKATK